MPRGAPKRSPTIANIARARRQLIAFDAFPGKASRSTANARGDPA
jgi:hypothetical protein